MQLTHSFTVPADIDQAWDVLLDIERIAPCMPGAALESVDGDEFTGSVKVRLGPIGLTYRGKARWVTKDAGSHRAVIDAHGKDARGNGTAKATITATLAAQGESTEVNVVTDLTITGKPAQFGRGVMVDVGNKLIGQFADCLAGKLAEPDGAGSASAAAGSTDTGGAAAGSTDFGNSAAGDTDSGSAAAGSTDTGSADFGGAGSADAELSRTEQEVAATLRGVEFDTAEQLGIAEEEPADRQESAQPAASAPDASSREESGSIPAASGPSLAEPGEPGPSLAAPGLADPDVVEAGEAGLRESTVATDSATAGAGLTGGEAVVAVPGPAPDEHPVEPAAASEAAPPAQRISEAESASTSAAPVQPSGVPVAHRPPPQRPAVAEVEPIDLLSSAGPAVAKRLAPVAAGVLLLAWLLLRRRRR